MLRKDYRVQSFDECRPKELRSPLGVPLSRRSESLNAQTVMAIVDNSERKNVLEKELPVTVLKHTVDADSTECSHQELGYSPQASTVL